MCVYLCVYIYIYPDIPTLPTNTTTFVCVCLDIHCVYIYVYIDMYIQRDRGGERERGVGLWETRDQDQWRARPVRHRGLELQLQGLRGKDMRPQREAAGLTHTPGRIPKVQPS